MRAIKKTTISFGLVSVPVKIIKATESHDIVFHQFHVHEDASADRISMVRTCQGCGEVIEYADLVKGVEVDEQVVTVTAEELKELDDEAGSDIEVLQFVDSDEIDPVLLDASYYLEADGKSTKAYALLRQVLNSSGKVGIVRFALRNRESLATLRTVGSALVLQTMHWADEVRDSSELKGAGAVEFSDDELAVAELLVDSLSAPFDASAHTDGYTARVQELIDTRAAGGSFEHSRRGPATEDVSDLLAALQASVAAKKPAA